MHADKLEKIFHDWKDILKPPYSYLFSGDLIFTIFEKFEIKDLRRKVFARILFPRKIEIRCTDSEMNCLRTVFTLFDKFSFFLWLVFFGQPAKFKPSLVSSKIDDNKVDCKAAGAKCNFIPKYVF